MTQCKILMLLFERVYRCFKSTASHITYCRRGTSITINIYFHWKLKSTGLSPLPIVNSKQTWSVVSTEQHSAARALTLVPVCTGNVRRSASGSSLFSSLAIPVLPLWWLTCSLFTSLSAGNCYWNWWPASPAAHQVRSAEFRSDMASEAGKFIFSPLYLLLRATLYFWRETTE